MQKRKLTSWFLTICLLITQILTPDVAQAASLAISLPNKEKQGAEAWAPSVLAGKVTQRILEPQAQGTLLHIQDAHAVFEAQKSIEALLAEIKEIAPGQEVFLEGGVGELDPQLRHLFPEGLSLTQEERNHWIKEGHLTGAEAYLMSNRQARGFGIEEAKSYWDNVELYRRVDAHRTESKNFLKSWTAFWKKEARQKLNPKLQIYLETYSDSQVNPSASTAWFDALRDYLKAEWKRDLSSADEQIELPMLTRYIYLKKIDAAPDYSKIEKQKKEFYAAARFASQSAKSSSPEAALKAIDALIEKAKTNQIDFNGAREIFEQIAAYLPTDFSMEKWPNLKSLIEKIILAGEINTEELLEEAKRLHVQIIKKDVQEKAQLEIVLLLEKQILLSKLLSLELTREDFEKISKHSARPREIAHGMKQASSSLQELASASLDLMERAYDDALLFYQGAIQRESAMEQVILKKAKSGGVSVVVTGGFHAEGMRSFAREQNWNYVALMPHISKISPEDFAHYRRALLGEGSTSGVAGMPSEVAAALITSPEMMRSPHAAPRSEAIFDLPGATQAVRRSNQPTTLRWEWNSSQMKGSATRPRQSDRPMTEWEGLSRPAARSETRLQEAMRKMDAWKARHDTPHFLERYDADPFMTKIEAQAALLYKQYRLNELSVRDRAEFAQKAFQNVQPAVSEYVAGWLDDIDASVLDSSDPIDYIVFQKISSNMASLEYRYSLAQNQMIRTAGNLVFDLSEQEKRFFELEYLLHEFDKEIEKPGTGNIPVVAAMQDLHGGTRRALGLIAKLYGLPPDSFKKIKNLNDLKRLLDEANLSTAMLSGRVVGFSDLVDRGDDPVGAMELAREFTQNSLGRFILGNHDLWRMMGVLGVHQLFGKETEADFDENEKADHPAWWAWEAFHHAGWGDRELEQLNERRINVRVRQVNKQIEHHNQTLGAEEKLLLPELDLESFGEELNKKLKEAKKKNEAVRGAWQKAVIEEDKDALTEKRPKKPIPTPQFVALPDVFTETLNFIQLKLEQKQNHVDTLRAQGVRIDFDFKDIQIVNRDNYQQDHDVLSNMLWQVQKFRLFYIDILGNLHMHNIIPMDYEAGGMAVHYRGLDGIAALELMTKDIREFFETVTIDDLIGAPEKVNEFRRRMWTAIGEALTLINSWYSDRVPVAKAIAVQRFIEEGNIEWYLGSAGSFVDREISGVVFWGHNEAKKFVEANLARILIYPNHGSGLINIDGGMSKGYENRGMEVTFGLRDESGQVQGLQAWGYHPKGADLDTDTVVDLTQSEEFISTMSPEQRMLLGHLAHGPTYLRWQRHKILTLLERGLDSFIRTPTDQRREKIVKMRKLLGLVHERLKKDRDPLKALGETRSAVAVAVDDAATVQGVDFLTLEQISGLKTWKDTFEIVEKILASPQNELSLAALKRVILKVRLSGSDFEMAKENSYSEYSDDIYEKARELTEKVIQKYGSHSYVVRHFTFVMPFDLDQNKKGKRDLWGLAADFDDRLMRDENGAETGYANTLRRLIHRAGFSFSKALELVRVYIDYLTSATGSWEPVRRAAVVNFESVADKELRVEVQKQMAEGKAPQAITSEAFQVLRELREKLTIAQNGIRNREFFEKWQGSLLAKTYLELQPWIAQILNPRQRGKEVVALNEAMTWISSELDLKSLSPELKYEQLQFYQSLGSLLQDLVAERLGDIGTLSAEKQYQRMVELILILQPMLYRLKNQGYLTRDSKDWINSLKEESLQLDQVHNLLQKIREDIAYFHRDFFQTYSAEARFLFGEQAVTVETALNMLLKEELEIKLADQLIEVMGRVIQNLPDEYKQKRANFTHGAVGSAHKKSQPADRGSAVFFSEPDRWMHQNDRRVWGGEKAAVLALARNRLGLPVPPGFVVPADVFMGQRSPDEEEKFQAQLMQGVLQIQDEWKAISSEELIFGDPDRPLFLAFRSGSTFVMPGQLATFIMIGMSHAIYKKMTESANPKEGYLAYYYFLISASELLGLSEEELNSRIHSYLDLQEGARVQDLSIENIKLLIATIEGLFVEKNLKKELDDLLRFPKLQITLAEKKTRESWNDLHAKEYRAQNHISDAWGTPLIVQKYVLGSFEKKSGSGLVRSQNSKGEKVITGDWLTSTQGYDLVSGFQTPQGLDILAEEQPAVYDQLRQIVELLDSYFKRPVLVEFTISQGRLWILQISRDKSVKSLKFPPLYSKGLTPRMIAGQGVSVYGSSGGFRGAVIYDLESSLDEEGQLKPEWIGLIQSNKLEGLIWVVSSMTPKKTALMLAGKRALEAKGFRLAIVSSEGGVLSHAATSAAENEVPAVVGVQQIRVFGDSAVVSEEEKILPQALLTIKFDSGMVYFGRKDLDSERSEVRSELRVDGFADGRLVAAGGAIAVGLALLHAVLGEIGFRFALGWGGAAMVSAVFGKMGFDFWQDFQKQKLKAPVEPDLLRNEVWGALDRWPRAAVQTWIEKEDSAVLPDLSKIRDHYVLGAIHFKKAAGFFQAGSAAGFDASMLAREIKSELKMARDQFQRVDYDRDAGILLNALNRLNLDSPEPSPSLIHFVEYFILARLRAQPRQAWANAPLPSGGYVLGEKPEGADLKSYPLPSKKQIVVFLLPGENKTAFKAKPLYRDLRKKENKIQFIQLSAQDYTSREALIAKLRSVSEKKPFDVLITPFTGLMPEKQTQYPAELQRYFEDAKDLYELEAGRVIDQVAYETDLVPSLANYFVETDEEAVRLSSRSLREAHVTQEYRTPYSLITLLMAVVAGTLGFKKGLLPLTEKLLLADAFYRTGIYGDERPQQPNEPRRPKRVFLVSPHPDDDVIAAKAVLADAMKSAQDGEVVAEVIVMQSGENGVVDLDETQMKDALRFALGYQSGNLDAETVRGLKQEWNKTFNDIRALHESVMAEYKQRHPDAAVRFQEKLEAFKGVDFSDLFDVAANQAWNHEELGKAGIPRIEMTDDKERLLKETAKYFIRRIENQKAIDFFNSAYPGKIRAKFFPEYLGYPSSGPQDLRVIHELEDHAAVVMQHFLMKFDESMKDAPEDAVISIVAPHRVDSHPHHVGAWRVIDDAMKLWSTQASRRSSRDVEVLYYFAPWSGNLPAYHLSRTDKKATNADLLRALIAGELTASRFGLPSPKELQNMQAQRYLVRPSILPRSSGQADARSEMREEAQNFLDWVKTSDFILRLGRLNQIELLVREGVDPGEISIASLLSPSGEGFAFGFDLQPIFHREGVTIINSGLYRALKDRMAGSELYKARHLLGADEAAGRAFNHADRRRFGQSMGHVKGSAQHLSKKGQSRSEMREIELKVEIRKLSGEIWKSENLETGRVSKIKKDLAPFIHPWIDFYLNASEQDKPIIRGILEKAMARYRREHVGLMPGKGSFFDVPNQDLEKFLIEQREVKAFRNTGTAVNYIIAISGLLNLILDEERSMLPYKSFQFRGQPGEEQINFARLIESIKQIHREALLGWQMVMRELFMGGFFFDLSTGTSQPTKDFFNPAAHYGLLKLGYRPALHERSLAYEFAKRRILGVTPVEASEANQNMPLLNLTYERVNRHKQQTTFAYLLKHPLPPTEDLPRTYEEFLDLIEKDAEILKSYEIDSRTSLSDMDAAHRRLMNAAAEGRLLIFGNYFLHKEQLEHYHRELLGEEVSQTVWQERLQAQQQSAVVSSDEFAGPADSEIQPAIDKAVRTFTARSGLYRLFSGAEIVGNADDNRRAMDLFDMLEEYPALTDALPYLFAVIFRLEAPGKWRLDEKTAKAVIQKMTAAFDYQDQKLKIFIDVLLTHYEALPKDLRGWAFVQAGDFALWQLDLADAKAGLPPLQKWNEALIAILKDEEQAPKQMREQLWSALNLSARYGSSSLAERASSWKGLFEAGVFPTDFFREKFKLTNQQIKQNLDWLTVYEDMLLGLTWSWFDENAEKMKAEWQRLVALKTDEDYSAEAERRIAAHLDFKKPGKAMPKNEADILRKNIRKATEREVNDLRQKLDALYIWSEANRATPDLRELLKEKAAALGSGVLGSEWTRFFPVPVEIEQPKQSVADQTHALSDWSQLKSPVETVTQPLISDAPQAVDSAKKSTPAKQPSAAQPVQYDLSWNQANGFGAKQRQIFRDFSAQISGFTLGFDGKLVGEDKKARQISDNRGRGNISGLTEEVLMRLIDLRKYELAEAVDFATAEALFKNQESQVVALGKKSKAALEYLMPLLKAAHEGKIAPLRAAREKLIADASQAAEQITANFKQTEIASFTDVAALEGAKNKAMAEVEQLSALTSEAKVFYKRKLTEAYEAKKYAFKILQDLIQAEALDLGAALMFVEGDPKILSLTDRLERLRVMENFFTADYETLFDRLEALKEKVSRFKEVQAHEKNFSEQVRAIEQRLNTFAVSQFETEQALNEWRGETQALIDNLILTAQTQNEKMRLNQRADSLKDQALQHLREVAAAQLASNKVEVVAPKAESVKAIPAPVQPTILSTADQSLRFTQLMNKVVPLFAQIESGLISENKINDELYLKLEEEMTALDLIPVESLKARYRGDRVRAETVWRWMQVLQAWSDHDEEQFVLRYASMAESLSRIEFKKFEGKVLEMQAWAKGAAVGFDKAKRDSGKQKLHFIAFQEAVLRSEARLTELAEMLPTGFEHRDFWVNEVRALENAEEPIVIERNALEFPAGETNIKRSPGYSATVFLNQDESGHAQVIGELGTVQNELQKLFPGETLLVPAEGLHVTIKGINHGIEGSLSLSLVQEFAEKLNVSRQVDGVARGKLVGPVWHRSLGVVMIYVPEGEDVLSAVKAETETALNLSREPRPFHMTLAYLPQSKLSPAQIREVQQKINSIPFRSISVQFANAEINGYENVAFTEVLRDPIARISLQRSEARFEHPALKYGRKIEGAVTSKEKYLNAEVYEFRGRFYLLVRAVDSRNGGRGYVSLNTAVLFKKAASFYILRDRFPAFAARQIGKNRPSENDPIYIRTQNELKNLAVILGAGQMHFFEIGPTDSKRVSAYHQVLGPEASEFSSLGAYEENELPQTQSRILRVNDQGKLVQIPDADQNTEFTLVDPDTRLRFYTGKQISKALLNGSNYPGEWQIYNPRGGKLRLIVKRGGVSEKLEINERGSILIKNLAPDTVIEWEDFSGAEFVVASDRDPDWFKPINDSAFDKLRDGIITERNGIRSTEWMESAGVVGIALSRKQDFKWSQLDGRQPTQWAISAQTEIHTGGVAGYPTHGGSLIQEISATESVTPLRDYSQIYGGEQIHSHRSNVPTAKAMELYYIAEGAVGFYIEVNGHKSFLKVNAGDVLVVDPHVIHGIMYVNLPYVHAAIQAPSVWAMANLRTQEGKKSEFKQFLGTTEDWLKKNPEEAAQMRYLMQSVPSGNYAIGVDFGAERGGTGLARQEQAFNELKNLFEAEMNNSVTLFDPPAKIREFFRDLSNKPIHEVRDLYGSARIQSLMFLTSLFAPDSFTELANWDIEFAGKLQALKQDKWKTLFESGTLTQFATKNSYAKVMALINGEQALVIPFYFGLFAHPDQAERVIRNKIWTGKVTLPLGLSAKEKYKIIDPFAVVHGGGPAVYGDNFSAAQIQNGRDFGIPLLQGEDTDAEQPTLYPYAFFQVLEITKMGSARSEMRQASLLAPEQELAARVFAAGFLPVGVSVAMRALSRAEIGAVLDQIVPQNQRTEIRLHAQRMLFGSQAVQPNDAFVLGADLALKRGFLAAIKKVFPDVFFAVIAAGSEKVELQSWLKEQALDEVVLVAENVQQARAELLKKNAKAVVRGLAITASSEADTLSRDLPVITFTSGQLDRMLSFAGVVAEAARLAQFAKAFAASA